MAICEWLIANGEWRMTKVTKLLLGKYGVIRAKKHIAITCPEQKLYPIRIRSSPEESEGDFEEPGITIVPDPTILIETSQYPNLQQCVQESKQSSIELSGAFCC